MIVVPDWLWFIVPLSAFFAPLTLVAYFVFRIYCLTVAQYDAHYQLGLAWFFISVELITISISCSFPGKLPHSESF